MQMKHEILFLSQSCKDRIPNRIEANQGTFIGSTRVADTSRKYQFLSSGIISHNKNDVEVSKHQAGVD